jgi:hypothetical protein
MFSAPCAQAPVHDCHLGWLEMATQIEAVMNKMGHFAV